MFPAFLTTIFFSLSVICGTRSAKLIGGTEANFWRLALATGFLAVWAHGFGQGLSGDGFGFFLLSGLVGIGVGDVALFQALPRIGSRLTILIIQCLSVPFAAAIEWLWLGTLLSLPQILFSVIILSGVATALAPGRDAPLRPGQMRAGVISAVIAAFGNGFGAVLSRKAYALAHDAGQNIDGGTAAYQRLVGGLLIGGICLLIVKWPVIRAQLLAPTRHAIDASKDKWKRVWMWVLANSILGQTIGVSFYQWALETTPTGIVLAIVATTPLIAIPLTRLLEKEPIEPRAVIGGVIAVVGVIGLIFKSGL